MKKYLPAVISGFIMCILGFVIGYEIAEKSEPNTTKTNVSDRESDSLVIKTLNYEELKDALLKKEKEVINDLQVITGDVETRKEGPVFSRETTRYLKGKLFNKALLVAVKDIRVLIGFYSEAGTLIREETIVINQIVPPFVETEFEEKIKTQDEYNYIELKIINATPVTVDTL